VIDFHCHLDLYPDPRQVAEECVRRGLYVLSVTTTPSAWAGTAALTAGMKRIRTAIGLHPCLAHERKSELDQFGSLLAKTPYVGEIGLDGSAEFKQHWRDQILVFEHILDECGSAGGRIMSIHTRRAVSETVQRLAAKPDAGVPILHWFSGTAAELRRSVDIGCWFSVGPTMLAGSKGRALAALMPKDRVLTETDGPFARVGGRSVLPWEAERAQVALAEIWAESPEASAGRLRENLRQLLARHSA
jgi:TatD DNase family protein